MRVDQHCENGDTSASPSQIVINQLREITGVQDVQILWSALKASQGDMSHAITLLTTQPEEGAVPEPEPEPAGTDGQGGVWVMQKKVAHMTPGGPKDELQAAIELSLQESQKLEAEEREFTRALEVSVEENAARMKRRRCEASGESSSPADWIRQDDWPVGMRNVGNTCWFSAVIQEKRNIAFMQELRCLFALMVGSTRKFVDPSAAVELLKDAFRTSEAQQDVSEFTHKLLDWLEDAFQLAANGNNPDDKQENPMVQLFYGTFVAERVHEGKTLSNIEQFGQYPLQVNGFNNLDECLEGAMVEGEIETLHSDQTISSGQERWFSKLPPVLTFELSRFEFNQSLGRPEKIHKKLEFPQIIYMDRYLHKNMEQTQGRREEVKRLKEQLTVLQHKLESYKNYGSGPAKYPLADMLQYVLEFATTKPTSVSPTEDLRTVLSPSSVSHNASTHADPHPTAQRTPIYKPFTQCRPPVETPSHPAPHSVTEEELHFVKSCLQRWRMEVENNINELKTSIDRVSQTLERIYNDRSLCQVTCPPQVPYRLHAVLVHEGQASAGHYWAYIFNHSLKRWLKYNDISVTESSWEELERDSYGGMTNASAYCLMYIDDKLPHLIAEDTDDETGQVLRGMDSLPGILSRYVREDNRWFQQELREWEEQFCRPPQEQHTAPPPENTQNAQDAEKTENRESPQPECEPEPEPEPEPAAESTTSHPPSTSEAEEKTDVVEEESVPVIEDAPDCLQTNVVEETSSQISQVEQEAEPDKEAEVVAEVKVEGEVEVMVENELEVKGEGEEELEVKQEEETRSTDIETEAREEEDPEPEPDATDAPTESTDTPPEESDRPRENQVSEVEIPNVGKILVRSDADGYNEEMMLTPAMQGIIMAIAKARQAFDKDGPEAGLIKAFHEEYSRLYELSQEETTPQQDPRLQHVLVYFFQNGAPNRKWHEDYSLFRTVFLYLLTGLELYQTGKIREALNYLAYTYQNNMELLRSGERKGVEQSLIALYRRKCLVELNESAATLFKSGEESDVEEGVSIMNDTVIPCMHLMSRDDVSQDDLDAIEVMRSRWCSYLGQDMDDILQEKLSEFLPRILDCSADSSETPPTGDHIGRDLLGLATNTYRGTQGPDYWLTFATAGYEGMRKALLSTATLLGPTLLPHSTMEERPTHSAPSTHPSPCLTAKMENWQTQVPDPSPGCLSTPYSPRKN
ncbi:hypothetical protein JZ751_022747 [Albula glossodonta]|uniref:ubiquitinyl hydrolase 1 n=1 Tax=Albula glossodonta TaxID=121402 RepID=A0A8T2PN20_9TELE|nr:hypothetical protein JZ751_022747 [Albula glossodonta]